MFSASSVLLVDDHALLRKSLHRMLDDDPELAVIGEASNGEEAVELARELAPQVVVMDIAMPRSSPRFRLLSAFSAFHPIARIRFGLRALLCYLGGDTDGAIGQYRARE